MDAPAELASVTDRPAVPPPAARSRSAMRLLGLLAAAALAAVAFAAYRQPELLLDLVGLRYCG